MTYLMAFLVGGLLCVLAQAAVDVLKWPPAYVMVLFVVLGAVLGGLGLYEPLVRLAGAGATVPLTGFGYSLVQGIKQEAVRTGWVGIFTGGLTATSMGVTVAVAAASLAALLFPPRD